jgi:hypothetical protein
VNFFAVVLLSFTTHWLEFYTKPGARTIAVLQAQLYRWLDTGFDSHLEYTLPQSSSMELDGAKFSSRKFFAIGLH